MAFEPKQATEYAVWALTPQGAKLGRKIASQLPGGVLFVSERLGKTAIPGARRFAKLKEAVDAHFHAFAAHLFIMSTGIVVRLIAPYLRHKTKDPAVMVMDEKGMHVISLLSGHLGGANALTLKVAQLSSADPVITTATDIQGVPAIDLLAQKNGLKVENPEAIKYVSMVLLMGESISIHDPFGMLPDTFKIETNVSKDESVTNLKNEKREASAGVFVDDVRRTLPEKILVLRPATLVAGVGCNRNTSVDEMRGLLDDVLKRFNLSPLSLKALASIDLKADESGLLQLAEQFNRPLKFFSREELNTVNTIQNPSAVVAKHVGVQSVCEAAAILGANRGRLVAPKQTTPNVTVAIARIPFTSSASGPAASTI